MLGKIWSKILNRWAEDGERKAKAHGPKPFVHRAERIRDANWSVLEAQMLTADRVYLPIIADLSLSGIAIRNESLPTDFPVMDTQVSFRFFLGPHEIRLSAVPVHSQRNLIGYRFTETSAEFRRELMQEFSPEFQAAKFALVDSRRLSQKVAAGSLWWTSIDGEVLLEPNPQKPAGFSLKIKVLGLEVLMREEKWESREAFSEDSLGPWRTLDEEVKQYMRRFLQALKGWPAWAALFPRSE